MNRKEKANFERMWVFAEYEYGKTVPVIAAGMERSEGFVYAKLRQEPERYEKAKIIREEMYGQKIPRSSRVGDRLTKERSGQSGEELRGVNMNETVKDKKLNMIREISEKADALTLEYVEGLSEKVNDPNTNQAERQKVFSEIDKVLRIAKQYSDRVLLAEGKATENIGLGEMNRPFNVLITKTYENETKDPDAVN